MSIEVGASMILAHRSGLLTGCKVLKVDGERVFVKVVDEKRPKWVDLSERNQKLFSDADKAIDWVTV